MSGDLGLAWEVMKWPFVASLLFPPLLVYLGLHVVKREVIFVDLALAQVATLGTCVALLMGYHFEDRITFWISRGVTLLLSRIAGGKEELEHLLTGDILNVTKGDVGQRVIVFAVLGAFFAAFHKRFVLISSDPERAFAEGVRVRLWDFLFYAAFAIVVVSFVRLGGVLLTFAYLIVPAVCATILAADWRTRLIIGWAIAAIASIVGLWSSYKLDLPTGAAIVVAAGLMLAIVGGINAARQR